MNNQQFTTFENHSIYKSKLWERVDLGFQRLIRCFEEVKTFSTEFDCSMKIIGLLTEQLIEEEDEEIDISATLKKIDYSDISFCKMCQEGQHVFRIFEEFTSKNKSEERKADNQYDVKEKDRMLKFKCVHGKKVLTMKNSVRNSLRKNNKESKEMIKGQTNFKNQLKKQKSMDMRGKVKDNQNFKQVNFPKYQRNLFRSSGSLDDLKEEGIIKQIIGLKKDKKKENRRKKNISDDKMNNGNKVSRILFEMENTNKPIVRRTSLDIGIKDKDPQGNGGDRIQSKDRINRRISYHKRRKTVSEKKIRNFGRKRTFDIDGSDSKSLKANEKGLNMKMNIREFKKIKSEDGKKERDEEFSEEDLCQDSDTLADEVKRNTSHRISFSEKFLKNHNNDIFNSKKKIENEAIKDKLVNKVPINLAKKSTDENISATPRFRISKEIIDCDTNSKENDLIQIETLGNSDNQFVFGNSKNSSKKSYGFCPLTEENTYKNSSKDRSSKFSRNIEDEDFINSRGHKQGFIGNRMKTISECTQESISKKILTQLKGNDKPENKNNSISNHRVPISTNTDIMRTRSDFSGNLIRNTVSIDRMMKKSFNLYNTEEKKKDTKHSVFGELKDSLDDEKIRSCSSGMYNTQPDRNLFSKKKEIEMGIISLNDDTVGMSIREKNQKFDRFSSENTKYEKQIFSGMNNRASSRDFILEKMLNSNEKLTTSALEKMLEQGQQSALMLKECFKDLLFKEISKTKAEELESKDSEHFSVKLGKRYKKKKHELKEKIKKLEKQNIEQRETIVRLETLLQTQEEMRNEKEKVIKEGNQKEIEMMRQQFEQAAKEREKAEREKEEQIKDWKRRLKEMEIKNEQLKDKMWYIETRASHMRFWDMKTGESVNGNKSMYADIMYSKSTIPKRIGKSKWDTRSQMDDRELKKNINNEYLSPKEIKNIHGKLIKSEFSIKERSKSLFNLGLDRKKKKRSNKRNNQHKLQTLAPREISWDKKDSEKDIQLENKEWTGDVSSVRSTSGSPAKDIIRNHNSFRSMQWTKKKNNLKSDSAREKFKSKRKVIKMLKLLKIEHCLSEMRVKKDEKKKKISLKEINHTSDIDDTMNFQTFQDSEKVIGTNNNFFNNSLKELQNLVKEDASKTQMSNKLDVDYSKNVFLNSGLVAEAKEMEQELNKEKIILIQELNSETKKLKESEKQSSHYMKLSGDLLKFLYCQALCIDTGLDTFEEFMEEDPISEQMTANSENHSKNLSKYDKFPELNMQAVKEVEEEHEVDTSPRDKRESNTKQKKSVPISEKMEKDFLKVPKDMKDALLSEKIETDALESINGQLSQGNERYTYESELIAKSNGFSNERIVNKHFTYSLPNHEIPSLVSHLPNQKLSNTLSGMPLEWRIQSNREYKLQLDNLPQDESEYEEKTTTDPRDFPEININPESLELTLREVSKAQHLLAKNKLKSNGKKKEIGRGLMEEYISGENRRYFIKDGIKMRVDDQGFIIKQEPIDIDKSPLPHRNALYNQTYSDSNSPSLSYIKDSKYKKNDDEDDDEEDRIRWTGESNSGEDEMDMSDDLIPSQQNFIIEDEGNIYMTRHQRQIKERRQLMNDSWGLPSLETTNLEQTVIPKDFDPNSKSGSSTEHESDEELNIYELSSRHVRSSFGSVKDMQSNEEYSYLQNQKMPSKDFHDFSEKTFKTLKRNQNQSKKSFKKSQNSFKNVKKSNSNEKYLTKDLFYTMKEKNDYS
jgi:hypothetical protein